MPVEVVKLCHADAATVCGAGELAMLTLAISMSPVTLALFSLGTAVLSLFSLLLASPSCSASGLPATLDLVGAFHRGISHMAPVKLLMLKPVFCHLRQGVPDRSRARRPALIAPWFALGPSLWAVNPLMLFGVPLGSMVPSSLRSVSNKIFY
jgi:hypothetical protein